MLAKSGHVGIQESFVHIHCVACQGALSWRCVKLHKFQHGVLSLSQGNLAAFYSICEPWLWKKQRRWWELYGTAEGVKSIRSKSWGGGVGCINVFGGSLWEKQRNYNVFDNNNSIHFMIVMGVAECSTFSPLLYLMHSHATKI